MPGTDAAEDLALLTEAAQAAGEIAVGFHGAAPKVWDKGDGQGPVSEADLSVDRMLRDRLLAARPDYGWLSEESDDAGARLRTRRQFIVDPIDGTRAFIDGALDWSHSIAVAEAGQVVAAVVHVPLRDAVYSAAFGRGAWLNDTALRTSARTRLDDSDVLANRQTMADAHWDGGRAPPVRRHFRSSLAYRMCLVAQGRFDAMVTLRPTWEWDVAAGALIVTEAGGFVTDRHGGAPVFNRPVPQVDGLIAAGALHAPLIAALGPPAPAA